MKGTISAKIWMGLWLGMVCVAVRAGPSLKIEHQPATLAMEGQPLLIRVKITDPAGAPRAVTLFYSVSRDAAPYRISMQPIGPSLFIGSVPGSAFSGVTRLSYYVEALDSDGVSTETPWYPVTVQPTNPSRNENSEGGADERPRWVKPAWIVGGAAVLVGGVVLASQSSGGSSDSSTEEAGTYLGSATTCYQPPGGSTTCQSRSITIEVDTQGGIRTQTLREGVVLEGRLSGSSFILAASVQEPAATGEIQYVGTVVGGRLSGTIQGSVTTPSGVGIYSGAFSANRK
ncbi:MAG: hypothetical protein U1E27_07100 [Kiritimatiellia bacterium]|nr:hypothetical protein [Kiritimatiellia bacterium]